MTLALRTGDALIRTEGKAEGGNRDDARFPLPLGPQAARS